MISDVACDPELPPELRISGMRMARMPSPAFSSAENPFVAKLVNISPTNRIASQPTRFRIIGQKPIWVYGMSSASIPPNFWTSSVCSFWSTSMTSSTVTTPMMWPDSLTTGNATRS